MISARVAGIEKIEVESVHPVLREWDARRDIWQDIDEMVEGVYEDDAEKQEMYRRETRKEVEALTAAILQGDVEDDDE